jgi:hypothetical protein
MARPAVISDPDDMPTILNIIHDCWFNKDVITFDPTIISLSLSAGFAQNQDVIRSIWQKAFQDASQQRD